jgi:hypothetical protein
MCSLAQACKRGRPTIEDVLITLVEALFKKASPKTGPFQDHREVFPMDLLTDLQ